MMHFFQRDGFYGVHIITGPRSARLLLGATRIEDFEVQALAVEFPYREYPPEAVQARVLEGTDAANRTQGSSFHPQAVRYAVEDWSEDCTLLRSAARRIVDRIVREGEGGYASASHTMAC
jgi:hypothetical protein